MNYVDDFERFAHDIINVVLQKGSLSGSAPKWQIEKVAKMLRTGPGITIWPRDAAEAAQRSRDKVMRRAPVLVLKLPAKPVVMPPPPAAICKVPLRPMVLVPPLKKP